MLLVQAGRSFNNCVNFKRDPVLRQLRNPSLLLLIAFVLSCVSRSTPEGRVDSSLALGSPGPFGVVDPNVFTFAAVGDLHIDGGNTTRFRDILNAAQAEGDEFILLLGDIVDQGELEDVQALHQAISDEGWTGRVFCAAGNHDIFYDGWTHYLSLTGSSTYSFTAGNSRFIALDTADATLGERQTEWLRNELQSSTETNVFLFSHYLPVIPGQMTYLKLASETESLGLMSLASREGVRAWLGAHYHSYIVENIAGVTYVVAGGGGGRRMAPESRYFFVQVSVNGSNVSYQIRPVN